jgi:guanylate kinase
VSRCKKKGRLFIISGPSGSGKSTLIESVLKNRSDLQYSISHTTRPPRGNEENGVDYYFISRQTFQEKKAAGDFAEWAEVHGHLYGTLTANIEKAMENGEDILMDIDVVGARKLLAKFPDAVSIFVAPPTMETLKMRLTQRNTDSPETVMRRLKNAEMEMAHAHCYDHVVVNEDLDEAVARIETILDDRSADG